MTNKSNSPPGPLTVESLTAAIHKHYCELEGKSGAIYDGPDGRAKTEAQGAKGISAVVKIGCQHEDDYHPADAINLCRNLANGYGCWLDTITEAIDTVDLSFTGEPDSFRACLDGARRGVFALIFHFEPNKRDFTDGE